ncbi:7,8-didemethyl-8-hydroxy-5-deazariboflavin synthase, CofG subunit [Halobacteroides halobius DSM 5150]|uniref:7,8-didemethyl-8-hydroxy-5-deazariboflavin synthase n=1 Tax=Halobacteroides halobius (strain ATCC 35273 / DSM 5150 / MD-1) TaxID=748449 RepID=L0KDS2_HALHC|nr:7,8-didemethyl-8-hydroxy-5-deazariboflavin synthase subunit CofG [Halobacteroides halobius]AGB42228.1 7,8-didemethyl-8-hydroxy-5-deazariboflavin synthase, CofG subunit [Halobacteroides halobius DSM 5150]
MKTVTYSKNIFIPLTNACYNNCNYCQFKKPLSKANITSLAQIKATLKQAKQAGCKEVLFTCGSKPRKVAGFKEKLKLETGFKSLFDLLVAACQQALEIGLLPHSNLGVISKEKLQKLARYNASLGLMLETTADVNAHTQSPTKKPVFRKKLISTAGQLKIPFTSGLLLGIGESRQDRIDSLIELKKLQTTYGHLQEIILQPVDPPIDTEITTPSIRVLIDTLELARKILPEEVALQVPPNLVDLNQVISYFIDDIGGISPLTIDYINPEHKWPAIERLQTRFPEIKFQERLPVYSQYLTTEWLKEPVWNCLQSEGWLDEYRTEKNFN